MSGLHAKRCLACEAGVKPLSLDEKQVFLKEIGEGWSMNEDCTEITQKFVFKGYYKTMAFVNAVAYIAHQEKHHPDLEVSYQHCVVRFTTHAMNDLSENDFICAAKVNQLLD